MTGRGSSPVRRRGFGLLGLLARHVRRPGPGLLAALLTLVATGFVLTTPRMEARAYDRALGDALAAQPPAMREIVLSYTASPLGFGFDGDFRGTPLAPPPSPFELIDRIARGDLDPALRYLGTASHSAQTDVTTIVSNRAGEDTRQAVIRIQSDVQSRIRWDRGQAPKAATQSVPMTAISFGNKSTWDSPVIPVGMLTRTAAQWGVRPGDRFRLTPAEQRGFPTQDVVVQVSGTYTPIDPADPFWQIEPGMKETGYISGGALEGAVQRVYFLTSESNYGPLGSALEPLPENPLTGPVTEAPAAPLLHEWRYPVDQHRVTRQAVPAILTGLANLANEQSWRPVQPAVRSGLEKVFRDYQRSVGITSALVLFPSVAGILLATLVLGLIGYLLTERRAATMRLLRVRGAGSWQILRLALTEAALWILPAWLIGLALVAAVVPGTSPPWSIGLSLVPVVGTLVVVASLSLATAGRPLRAVTPESGAGAARRIVLELLVVATAYFAVGTLRSRGDLIQGGQRDWYAALAPAAVTLAVAVVVLWLYPLPVRWFSRLAARGRSVHAFLGLARSARDRGAALIPLVAILLAAALGSYLAAVDRSIAQERVVAAYRSTGADVRVDAERLDPKDIDALRARAGVSAVAPAYVLHGVTLAGAAGEGIQRVTVIATDLPAYAAALQGTPLAFTAPNETGPLQPGRLPVLTNAPLRLGATDVSMQVAPGRVLPVRIVGIEPGLSRSSAGSDEPVVAVPYALLRQLVATVQPNTAFVMGDREAAAALMRERPSVLTTGVTSRYAAADHVRTGALPTLVRRLSLLTLGLSLLLAPMALLLLLAVTRPARDHLILRLRTLGLAPGGEWRLSAVEVVPLALAGIVPGLIAGWYLNRLLSEVIDLGPYTGSAAHPPVHLAWWIPLVIGGSLLLLAVLTTILDARRARRGRLADHLRAGEST